MTEFKHEAVEVPFSDEFKEKLQNQFGLAPIRKEGESVWDDSAWDLTGTKGEPWPKPKYETDWLEYPVPTELFDEAQDMLEKWLISKGIDLKEL